MASIFKKSVIKDKIAQFVDPDFDKKIDIIRSWYDSYTSGLLQKKNERQCEQEYINDIFKDVLGYEGFPNEPYTLLPQITSETSAQRPDVGLGYFDSKEQRIFAVVEIKDVNTALDQSQRREGNLTPIQQAFKYKPQFKECRFVIATNIYEMRLFQDNQLDYEVFTLKSLSDSANSYFDLKRFILLLGAHNFVSKQGKSNTEELLAEIRVEQEKVTRRFYNEYSDIRLRLMRDIWKNNSDVRNIHLIADYAQKILDRTVFVSFCEDTGLLPDNTLLRVYKHAESSFSSIWDTLRGFYHAVDSGSIKLGIPNGYNGGLFSKDEKLDTLKISDDACKDLGRIAKYDFENELTVNVLGHVFEQSITDLEEIKKKVEPDEANKMSKRKKDGIFYTPEYVVDYIVQNSLGRYLKENENRIFKECKLEQARTDQSYREREKLALKTYQTFLHSVKIVDPACGSGAFLVKVFDYLLEENKRVGRLIGGLFDDDLVFREILKNNIFGVDLNEESVRITQLSLWLKTAQKGKKLTYLDNNIRCGNSLIDDPATAGKKAFNWRNEFKDVFNSGGFDVVVGNPPYVRPENSDKNEREYFISSLKYKYIFGRFDLYILFLELATHLLKENGIFSYIIPSSLFNQNYAKIIRKAFIEDFHLLELIDLSDQKVFEAVSVKTAILTVKNEKLSTYKVDVLKVDDKNTSLTTFPRGKVDSNFFLSVPNSMYRTDINETTLGLINKIKTRSCPLSKYCYIVIGAVPHNSETGASKDRLISPEKLTEKYKPYIEGKDVGRYYIDWDERYLNYIPEEMHRPKFPELFENKKILIRNISDHDGLIASYDDENFYCNDTLSICIPWDKLKELEHRGVRLDENDYDGSTTQYSLITLMGVINSKAINYFFKKHLSSNLHVYPEAVRCLPVPRNMPLDKIEDQTREILVKQRELLEIKHKTESLISGNTNYTVSLPNIWYKLDWLAFRKLIRLLPTQKEELIYEIYDKGSKEASLINDVVVCRQNEIDTSVYESFALTKDEINQIESTQ